MAAHKKHHSLLLVACLCVLVSVTLQSENGFVVEVTQNFDRKVINTQLSQQVIRYLNLEMAYRAYAAYFGRADVALPGFQKLFQDLARRSRDSSISMTTYINSRGGNFQFSVVKLVDACKFIERRHQVDHPHKTAHKPQICYFQLYEKPFKKPQDSSSQHPHHEHQKWRKTSGLHGLVDALSLERTINQDLIDFVDLAKNQGDPHTKLMLESSLEDQTDMVKKLADLETRLRQYEHKQGQENDYELGEYLLDTQLSGGTTAAISQ